MQIVDRRTGAIVQQYPRGTRERLLIDPACYESDADAINAPRPLGKVARKLQALAAAPVQLRSIEIYAELAEVVQ